MRTKQIDIPSELIGEIFAKVDEAELQVELIEVNEIGELVVEVEYDQEEDREHIMSLIEMIDDYNEDQHENEEAEEEDEES